MTSPFIRLGDAADFDAADVEAALSVTADFVTADFVTVDFVTVDLDFAAARGFMGPRSGQAPPVEC
ncbi:MAG: hypothetical protein ABWY35_02730, partial [Pseudorhodoplanes sp.]